MGSSEGSVTIEVKKGSRLYGSREVEKFTWRGKHSESVMKIWSKDLAMRY